MVGFTVCAELHDPCKGLILDLISHPGSTAYQWKGGPCLPGYPFQHLGAAKLLSASIDLSVLYFAETENSAACGLVGWVSSSWDTVL